MSRNETNEATLSKPKFFSKAGLKAFISKPGTLSLLASLGCILAGLLIGLIILICMNPSLAFTDFGKMITGNIFASPRPIKNVQTFFTILAKSAPLMCCGLSIIFAQKSGMFNIGVAGQYVMGAFGALMFALQFKAPWYVCLLMAGIFGAIWGILPGLFKAFFNVNEVISGIMLNWIALFFMNYSFQTYLSGCVDGQQGAKTYVIDRINPSGKLPGLGLKNTLGANFSIAILLAVIFALLCWFIIKKTTLGYQLRASGYNKDAAKYAGMNEKRNIIISLGISGALAGMGAALYYLAGIEQWSVQLSNSLPNMPWNGIITAFVAQNNPIGVIFSSLFITIIAHGSGFMTQTVFPFEISNLITGIIVYFCGLSSFIVGLIIKYHGKNPVFWQNIKSFFKKTGDWFKRLFKKKDKVNEGGEN